MSFWKGFAKKSKKPELGKTYSLHRAVRADLKGLAGAGKASKRHKQTKEWLSPEMKDYATRKNISRHLKGRA